VIKPVDPLNLESMSLEELRALKAKLIEEHPDIACLADRNPRRLSPPL
jgi:hypothetical protein